MRPSAEVNLTMEDNDPLDTRDQYSYSEPSTHGDIDLDEDTLYPDGQLNSTDRQAETQKTVPWYDLRCTGGREYYRQAIDHEYGDYRRAPIEDKVDGRCVRCQAESVDEVKEWCDHFRIREETLKANMTVDGWASCDCRSTSINSISTTVLGTPVFDGFCEFTPVYSDGQLLDWDTAHVPKCLHVNPFNRPHSDKFPTLQSMCVQTIAEARPLSVVVKDIDPRIIVATNRPLCQREHSSPLDCFEWTTSEDFHDNCNANVHVFYFQPPHPQWINLLPPSLSKRVMRYYVNRHLMLLTTGPSDSFKWEELSPQQLYHEITNEPNTKFRHISYCQHAFPKVDLWNSDKSDSVPAHELQ